MTYYMYFIQTLVIRSTINVIQPLEKACDLDLTFKGNPRSKVTRSTERSYMTLYMYFIQTLVTACTVSEILA